ncbi:peptidylprolyl isomerase [Nocardioides zeae]|uniref:Peptidylprolyl isomerase n=1 Tax=Nocardioides imazamoxiresistens TaxID=3231893 RepID=A0ABU3PT10_9ACTN|nr:peptidylprolyl isomerase [Nocardioides zeae]MDT9592374.1 peptidylprolyl isomerase [Nocardioides zeae]
MTSRPRRLGALGLLLTVPLLAACGSSDDEGGDDTSSGGGADGACTYAEDSLGQVAGDVDLPAADPTVAGEVGVSMALADGATIEMTLDADAAPCTVNSFVSLAEQGYYDDTTCHRLTVPPASIQVLQCGDPTATGAGGPGYTIPDELEQTSDYPAGTVAMAKRQDPDSGGSQFFLVYGDTLLPPEYTVFGTMDEASVAVVQAIADGGTDTGGPDGAPATPAEIATVTVG